MYQTFPDSEFNNEVTSPDRLTCMISSNVFVKLEELTTGKEAEGPEQRLWKMLKNIYCD
jgi:hypothetical protein